jgi:hypothetical protein
MNRARVLAAWSVLLAAGCATPLQRPLHPYSSPVLEIAPDASYESCVLLEAGDRLLFSYQVDPPMRFAIRRRVGGAMVSYLLRDAGREDRGIFFVPQAERYCLHWEPPAAGSQWPSLLRFDIRLNP